jgi:replication factor C subunit 3/5
MKNDYLPWVEKYRPDNLEDIVLSKYNKATLINMIKQKYIPNMLLYGPPGTGKTTTVINLIKNYQKLNNELNQGLLIHLNASDERGIDIIRNQIQVFVNSNGLFKKGIKFVVLDEVDYMTKNAQQALKQLIQEYNESVRYFLICNYISKVDQSLQQEFILMRFSQLPKEDILIYLNMIIDKENIKISNKVLNYIINNFNYDIRSMINYLQANQNNIDIINNIVNIDNDCIISNIKNNNLKKTKEYIEHISRENNIDIRDILTNLLKLIINKNKDLNNDFFEFYENYLHTKDDNDFMLDYCLLNIKLYVN